MKKVYYTPSTPMVDVMKDDFHRQDMLCSLGFKPGFKENTSVLEACNDQGVNVELFLLINNLYTYDDYAPDDDIVKGLSVEQTLKCNSYAQDFFFHVNGVDLRRKYDRLKSRLEDSSMLTGLFDALWDSLCKQYADIDKLIEQYANAPESITSAQVEHIIIGLEQECYKCTEHLIEYLEGLRLTGENRAAADDFTGYLKFFRKDCGRFDTAKNVAFRKMIRS